MSAEMTPQDHEDLAKMRQLPERLPAAPTTTFRLQLSCTSEGLDHDGPELDRWLDGVIQRIGPMRLADPEWVDRFVELMWRERLSIEVALLLADLGGAS